MRRTENQKSTVNERDLEIPVEIAMTGAVCPNGPGNDRRIKPRNKHVINGFRQGANDGL